jgi:hypothetical protein
LIRRRVTLRLRPEARVMGAEPVGLECAGVLEAGSVVADLAEEAGTGGIAETGEAFDDGVVGMGLKGLRDGLTEAVHVRAGRHHQR